MQDVLRLLREAVARSALGHWLVISAAEIFLDYIFGKNFYD
jgi:hypothetical protein